MDWREEDGVLHADGYCIVAIAGQWRLAFGECELGHFGSRDEAMTAAEKDNQDETREYQRDFEIQFTVKNSFTLWDPCSPKVALVRRFGDIVDDE